MLYRRRAKFPLPPAIFFCVCLTLTRAAAGSGVSLEALPSKLKVGRGESAQIALVGRNDTAAPVQVIKLDHIESAGVTVTVFRADPDTSIIAPGTALRWIIGIAHSEAAAETCALQFFVDYAPADAKPETVATNTSSVGVSLELVQPSDLDKVLDVRTEGVLKVLEEPNSGVIFVVAHNKLNTPVSIRSIDVVASTEVEPIWKNSPKNTVIGPQGEAAFGVEIKAKDAILPGKYLLLFTVSADWNAEGVPRSGSKIAKYEFDAGILGDSAMLAAIGVPSFLLLPGFLMILVFGMLWNLGEKRKKFPLDIKLPQFWAGAILLSLTTALLYPVLIGRSYLKGYRFRDVCYVWFGSAGVALLAWALAVVFLWGRQRFKAKALERSTFSIEDKPLDVLNKLSLNHQGFKLKHGDISPNGQPVRGFVLHDGAGSESWIAPLIQLKSPGSLTADIDAEFNARVAATDDPAGLAEFIERNQIVATWDETALTGPTRVTEFKPANAAPASLVERG
jgi:hypothetical protein